MIVNMAFSTAKQSRRWRVTYVTPERPNTLNFRWFTDSFHAERWLKAARTDLHIRKYNVEHVGR
jgi:hypothetical protein